MNTAIESLQKLKFQRKPPILHRALGGAGTSADSSKKEDEKEELPETHREESGLVSIEELATKKRVKKRDNFQRNALHVAVRVDS
jgi:hypothetical protein